MATLKSLFSTLLMFLYVLFIISQKVYSKSNKKFEGIHLRMVHIDSSDSPMYQPELTDIERAKRLLDISKTRVNYLSFNDTRGFEFISRYHEQDLNLKMMKQGRIYFVEVGLGTFDSPNPPFHKNFLAVDTGSEIIWTQCEGCNPRFPQRSSLFPMTKSKTYQPIPCNQCPNGQCNQGRCTIYQKYGDMSEMKGILARETFHFVSPSSSVETINGLAFVCATGTRNAKVPRFYNYVTGILGMSRGERSLVSQIGARGAEFSYCLQDDNTHAGTPMILSFGASIPRPRNMPFTPILTPTHNNRKQLYYVNLTGISVNGKKLNIPQNVFAIKDGHIGGTIFDIGTSTSNIISDAFDILKSEIIDYVASNNKYLKRYLPPNLYDLEACWEPMYDSPKVNFPTVMFHFENNANLLIQPDKVVSAFPYRGPPQPGLYCMTFLRSPDALNLIGALHQINTRVITNVRTSQIYLAEADCSK